MEKTSASKHRNHKLAMLAAILLIAISAIGGIAWNMENPVQVDDWPYQRMPEAGDATGGALFWRSHGDDIEGFGDAFRAMWIHYSITNARLSNNLHILFVPLPREIEAVLLGLAIGAMALTLALAGDRRRRLTPLSALLATVLMWTCFQWYDNMQSLIYQCNYVLPTVMVCLVVWLMPNIDRWKRGAYAAFIAFTFVTSLMHEGFTAILLVYAAAFPLCLARRPSKRYIIFCVAIAAALAVHVGSPVISRRGLLVDSRLEVATRALAKSVPLFAAIVLSLLDMHFSRLDMRRYIRRYGALLCAAVAGAAVPLILVMINRTYWMMSLFSVLIMIQALTSMLRRVPARYLTAAALIAAVPYALWMVQLVKWEKRVADELRVAYSYVLDRQAQGLPHSSLVPVEVTPASEIPGYLLGIPEQGYDDFNTLSFFLGYARHFGATLLPADPSYASRPLEEWPKVPGDNPLYGRWPYVAQPDSTFYIYNGVFGPPQSTMPLFDRLLCRLMGRNGEVEFKFWWGPKPVPLANGDTIYRAFILPLPRTVRHRELLRIDTAGVVERKQP